MKTFFSCNSVSSGKDVSSLYLKRIDEIKYLKLIYRVY